MTTVVHMRRIATQTVPPAPPLRYDFSSKVVQSCLHTWQIIRITAEYAGALNITLPDTASWQAPCPLSIITNTGLLEPQSTAYSHPALRLV